MRSLTPQVPGDGPRAKILRCVVRHPGIHLRQIERRTGLALGQVLYHLERLRRMDLVTVHRDRGFKRYYGVGTIGRSDKPTLSALRHHTPRHVILALLREPGQTHKDLQTRLGIAGSTASFHLQRLVESGILERRHEDGQTTYRVRDPGAARRQLLAYGASFQDEEVDAFVAEALRSLGPAPRDAAETAAPTASVSQGVP